MARGTAIWPGAGWASLGLILTTSARWSRMTVSSRRCCCGRGGRGLLVSRKPKSLSIAWKLCQLDWRVSASKVLSSCSGGKDRSGRPLALARSGSAPALQPPERFFFASRPVRNRSQAKRRKT